MADFKMLNRFNTSSAKWDGMANKIGKDTFLAFTVADSDYPTAKPITDALQKRLEHGALGYTMVDNEYFNIIKQWYKRRYDVTIKNHWIVPSSKVLSGLSFLIQKLTDENDPVMLQSPVYNVFEPLINLNNRPLVDNALVFNNNTYSIDFEMLEKQFKKGIKLLVFCNPHNPVGRVWSYEELSRLVTLAKAYDVYILSDEIHGDLIMENQTFVSLGKFFEDYEKIVVISAPSKTFNLAGLQGSNMIIPNKNIREKMKKKLSKNFLSSPNMMALTAIKTAYSVCDDWLEAQNDHIYNNYLKVKECLATYNISLAPLEGTYLLWIDFRPLKQTSDALFNHFLKYDIALAKGTAYSKAYDGFMRMNVAVSKEQLDEGLSRLKKALDAL